MNLHVALPTHLLAVCFLLLLASPASAVSTRQESQQQLRGSSPDSEESPDGFTIDHPALNYEVPHKVKHLAMHHEESKESDEKEKAVDEDGAAEDDSEDDDDSDDDKAAEKAKEIKEAQLKNNVKKVKADLAKNVDEQEEISAWMGSEDADEANPIIESSVKAVANETASAVLANYLGDMWKEQRKFQSPFYEEHQMERQSLLEKVEPALRDRVKVEQLKLKKQKIAWEKEDAEADAEDEKDEKEKAKDEKKVAKLAKEEKKVAKEEEQAEKKEVKAEKKAEKEASGIMGPLPWMKDKKDEEEPAPAAKAPEPAEDNTVKPDWMKAMEGSDAEKKKASIKEDDDEEEEAKPKKKSKDDDDDFDIMDKPPWMKNKDKQKKKAAPAKKPAKPAEDNTVKPDWMKSLENSDDEDSAEEGDSADEDEESPAAKPKKAKLKAHGKHKPMFTKKTMPAVSPATQCVIMLVWQFFVVYTVLAVLRSVNQLSKNRFPSCTRAQELVSMVCPYVMFCPMLSILFLATRMRAIQLSQGDTEKHELPQPWVQAAMYAATFGVLFQAVFKLLLYSISYRFEPNGEVVPVIYENRLVSTLFSTAKYVFTACIYGGFTAVCIGAIYMPAPKEVWDDGEAPPVSAALGCTLILTTTFFTIYLALSLFRTAEELRPSLTDEINIFVKVQLLFWRARHAVNLAPMLCILFIAARMRALQIDPKNGNPPSWAQTGMYCCAGALVFQVAASIVLPLIDRNAYILPGPVQGQIILVMSISYLKIFGVIMKYVPLLFMYGGASAIVASIFLMKAPKGQTTPEISAMTSCIIGLTTLYFVVFTAVYVAQTVMELLRESSRAKRVLTVLDAGQRTVMFAPMLCVLFIAARMRALQLTVTVNGTIPSRAGPQTWVQEGMYFATSAVFIQVLMAYITTAILGPGAAPIGDDISGLRDDQHAPRNTVEDAPDTPHDKRSISPNWAVAGALDIFKYLCLLAMYGGVVTVMVGIVVMTPETLPPYHESPGVVQGLMKML